MPCKGKGRGKNMEHFPLDLSDLKSANFACENQFLTSRPLGPHSCQFVKE
jgi:hypothetical protein